MAKYDREWVKSYFNEFGQKEWERWDSTTVDQIKLEVHLHYIRKYLKANARVLEIGAGPGRFTQYIAQITNRIIVADISPVQLQLNQENARNMGYSDSIQKWIECDICDLQPHFKDAEFDVVVCYGGPLSYVFEERTRAISELLRITKPNGLLLLSVMSLWGTLHHCLPLVLDLDPGINTAIIATGDLDSSKSEASTHFSHMYRASEFRQHLEKAGAEILAMSASDCLVATWSDSLADLQKDTNKWQHLLEMEIEACCEPGCLDMGTHLIAVCKKST